MVSMEEQKKIAIEMWQYIKVQIMQHEPIYSITSAKQEWLMHNHPDIEWKSSCLLCAIYSRPYVTDNGNLSWKCPQCPLSKKYKYSASYGCSMGEDTPWSRIVSYDIDEKAAVEACDEIIAVIKSL